MSDSTGIPLFDLTKHQCRFPVNDRPRGGTFLFCAAEIELGQTGLGRAYCAHHAALARAERQPKAANPHGMAKAKRPALLTRFSGALA